MNNINLVRLNLILYMYNEICLKGPLAKPGKSGPYLHKAGFMHCTYSFCKLINFIFSLKIESKRCFCSKFVYIHNVFYVNIVCFFFFSTCDNLKITCFKHKCKAYFAWLCMCCLQYEVYIKHCFARNLVYFLYHVLNLCYSA